MFNEVDTILLDGITQNDIDKVKRALLHGADVNSYYGQPIKTAAENGNDEIVAILLTHKKARVEHSTEALVLAASKGHCEVVKLLIDYGAVYDDDDYEAAKAASDKGQNEVLRLLISVVANCSMDNAELLMWSAYYGHLDTINLLAELDPAIVEHFNDALETATENRNTDVIKRLLELGAVKK